MPYVMHHLWPTYSDDFKELPLSPPEPDYNYEMSGDFIPTNDDEELEREFKRS